MSGLRAPVLRLDRCRSLCALRSLPALWELRSSARGPRTSRGGHSHTPEALSWFSRLSLRPMPPEVLQFAALSADRSVHDFRRVAKSIRSVILRTFGLSCEE